MSKQKRFQKIGTAPGSLLYTGNFNEVSLLWNHWQYDASDLKHNQGSSNFADSLLGEKNHWLVVNGLNTTVLFKRLCERLKVHPLVQEDILHVQQRPRAEALETGTFIVLPILRLKQGLIEREQVSFWLQEKVLTTFCETPNHQFKKIVEVLNNPDSRLRKNGCDYLLYRLLDHILDCYFLLIHDLEEQLEQLNLDLMTEQQDDQLKRLHSLKTNLLTLQKISSPFTEMVTTLKEVLSNDQAVYWQDLKDHTIQIQDSLKTLSAQADSLFNLYFSLLSAQTNRVVQRLTVVTLVFLPLTLITGIYGMNFEHMPELRIAYAYPVVLGIMGVTVTSILVFLKFKKWF